MSESSIQIKPIKSTIGAVIEGVDLNQVDEHILGQIKQALLDHQVIFFRNQNLQTPTQVVEMGIRPR